MKPHRVEHSAILPVEASVLACLACGMQSKEIADAIGKKVPTVEGYIRSLYIKLGAKSRAHLVARAYETAILVVNKAPKQHS